MLIISIQMEYKIDVETEVKPKEYQIFVKIVKTVLILLLICFIFSLTSILVITFNEKNNAHGNNAHGNSTLITQHSSERDRTVLDFKPKKTTDSPLKVSGKKSPWNNHVSLVRDTSSKLKKTNIVSKVDESHDLQIRAKKVTESDVNAKKIDICDELCEDQSMGGNRCNCDDPPFFVGGESVLKEKRKKSKRKMSPQIAAKPKVPSKPKSAPKPKGPEKPKSAPKHKGPEKPKSAPKIKGPEKPVPKPKVEKPIKGMDSQMAKSTEQVMSADRTKDSNKGPVYEKVKETQTDSLNKGVAAEKGNHLKSGGLQNVKMPRVPLKGGGAGLVVAALGLGALGYLAFKQYGSGQKVHTTTNSTNKSNQMMKTSAESIKKVNPRAKDVKTAINGQSAATAVSTPPPKDAKGKHQMSANTNITK